MGNFMVVVANCSCVYAESGKIYSVQNIKHKDIKEWYLIYFNHQLQFKYKKTLINAN